jgi:CHAT domain-containing protein
LPGTSAEVLAIKTQANNSRHNATVQMGADATEESLKALNRSSPAVLHIATHGFFYPDPKNIKQDDVAALFDVGGRKFKQSDNPLLRSGLAFAGANNAWRAKPAEGIEDGILTALEVSNMYLPNTKLVVLSACETALGDIQGNEGIYGLQRAFSMAGVPNLVMSLWKVPDHETSEFMQVFYQHIFAKKEIRYAFNLAQREMKNRYPYSPYKWAAWILVQ